VAVKLLLAQTIGLRCREYCRKLTKDLGIAGRLQKL